MTDIKVGDIVRYTGAGFGPPVLSGTWAKRAKVGLPYVVTRLQPYEGGHVHATCVELVTKDYPPGEYSQDEMSCEIRNLELVHSTTWSPNA